MMRLLKRKTVAEKRRNMRGQTATEYMMVLGVLAVAVMYSAQASMALFGEAMDVLTTSLSSSLTTDGIRP